VTAYAILKDLQRRNVATLVEKDNIKHFQVVDPTKLLAKLEEKTEQFKTVIPQLLAMTDIY
jgi:hypothetical protein